MTVLSNDRHVHHTDFHLSQSALSFNENKNKGTRHCGKR